MSVPLIEYILELLRNEDAQKEFANDAHGSLAAAGLSDLCGEDVKTAMPFVKDAGVVKRVHGDDDDDHEGREHDDHRGHDGHGDDDDDVEGAIRYLKYITKNYTYEDNDTYDNSVNQNIWNSGELELEQYFDNDQTVASGDGSVAAGDDVEGTVTTGDHNTVVSGDENTVGDGNVDGNNNDVANGAGSAAGEGNNVANGANSAAGEGAVAGSFGDGANVATTGGEVDDSEETNIEVEDSFKSYDSHDDESVEVEDSFKIDDSGDTENSHNVDESVTQTGLANVNDSKVDVDVEVASLP